LRTTKALFTAAAREFLDDDSPTMAAALSYYLLFAIFPLLIFAVGLAGLFLRSHDVQQQIVDKVLDLIPLNQGEGRSSVTDAVTGVAGPGGGLLGLVGLLGMAWSGSAMFGAVRKALNRAFDDEHARRPFVPQKLMDLGLVLAITSFFLASIAAMAALRFVADSTESLGGWGDAADKLGLLWDLVSYLVPLVFSFIGFLALYSLVPGRVRRPADIWPGALVAAVLFEAAKLGFSFYLENFTHYNAVFGALGAAVALLFWLYVTANVTLFGAEVASEYPRVRAEAGEQPVMEGLKLPLRRRLTRALKGLFVRQADEPPSLEGNGRQHGGA